MTHPHDGAAAAAPEATPPGKAEIASPAQETMAEALERRRALVREERGGVQPPDAVRGDVKALFRWHFTCLYQDNAIFVIAASAVLGFEIIKTIVDLVSNLF